MGKIGRLFKFIAFRLLELTFAFLLVVYIPGLPPEGSFTSTTVAPAKALDGVYALNNYLDNAEHLFEGKVRGPEGIADWKGELYASVHGGEIVRLSSNGQVTHVAKFGQPCDGYWQEKKCGRPLGLEFDPSGMLYAVDAYYGIWKVNIQNGHKQLLVSPSVEIEGRKPKLFNGISLAANGDFYWTDSSSEITLEDGVFGMLLDGSGRLFHYDAAKNKSSVLLDGLWFANGVSLSPNEDFVVVSETARGQLRRYYLKGPLKGTDDIFIDGLPGLPDNLKREGNVLYVPLVAPRDDKHPVVFQSLAPHALIRKFLARLLSLIEMPFIAAQKVLPHYVFERAAHMIGHFESVQALVPKRVTILKLDWSGNVLETWHNIDRTLSGISDVHIFQNKVYLGSPYNMYLGRVSIPNIEPGFESATPRKVQTQAQVPTPKPTEAPKPKPTESPKPKPTEAPKPKPTEAPKPKPTEAPKPKPTEAPKPKPTEAPKPKPTEAPKPKPTEAPKPKPTEAPKPKPTEAPKPKPTEAPKPPPKVAEQAPVKNTPKESATQPPPQAPTVKPIVEEIPSDTKPPKKENLKVIKKEGPATIPNPNEPRAKEAQPNAKNEL